MTIGVYIIRNRVNGKVYVGSSVTIKPRLNKTDPEMKKRAQALANIARATPEHRKVRQEIAARTVTTEATRKKNSDRLKALWQDPEFRAKRLAGLDRGREKTNSARRKRPSDDEIVSSAANTEAVGVG